MSFFPLNAHMQAENTYTRKGRIAKLGELITPATLLLMPLNINNAHWVLLEFDVSARKARVYDPLVSSTWGAQEALNRVLTWLEQYAPCSPPKSSWELVHAPQLTFPRQSNYIDCGVFVYKYMERISAGL